MLPTFSSRRSFSRIHAAIEALEPRKLLSTVSFAHGTTVIASNPVQIATADLRGIGKTDLIVAGGNNGTVQVHYGNGDGTFGGESSYYNVVKYPFDMVAADVTGDGTPDVIVAGEGEGYSEISVLVGERTGNQFSFQQAVNTRTTNLAYSFAVADINGDGHPDLVTANGHSGTISIFFSNGDGTFQAPVSYTLPAAGNAPVAFSVVTGDFNGDGAQSIAVLDAANGAVDVFLNDGSGTFAPAPLSYPVAPGGDALAAADLTGNGQTDIIATGTTGNNGNISVLPGNGDGTFAPAVNSPAGFLPGPTVIVADVNGDGIPDVVLSNNHYNPGTVTVLTGNGDGSFAPPQTFNLGNYPAESIAVADLNGDGLPDILAASSGSHQNTVSVLLNNTPISSINSLRNTAFTVGGPGTFTVTTQGFSDPPTLTEAGDLPNGVSFVDNGNGTGTLSGTPTADTGGVYPLVLTAFDGVTPDRTQSFVLTVNQAPAILGESDAGSALEFNGVDQFATIPRVVQDDFTIDAWIRTSAPSLSGSEFYNGNGLIFADVPGNANDFGTSILNNKFAFGTGNPDTTIESNTTVTTGQWINLAAERIQASGQILIFINGVQEVSTFTGNTGPLNSPSSIFIGADVNDRQYFQGEIDNLSIWNVPLTAAQIQGIMNKQLTGAESGLAGYWPLDDMGNGSIADLSPGHNTMIFGDGNTSQYPTFVPSTAPIVGGFTAAFPPGGSSTFTVVSTGFPTSVLSESGTLPTGVTFTDNHDGTASLSGTPGDVTGNFPISITAANSAFPSSMQSFNVNVGAAQGVAITSSPTTTFTVGASGTFTVTTTGFSTPPAISETGALPPDLTFRDNGDGTATLSGVPGMGTGGTIPITITAAGSTTAAQQFTLTIDQAPAIISASTTTFVPGVVGSFTVSSTGFPIGAALGETGPLPSGVSFVDNGDGTATIAGAAPVGSSGTSYFTITASNGIAPPAFQTFTLMLAQVPVITSISATTFTVGAVNSYLISTENFSPSPHLKISGPVPAGVSLHDNGNGTATLTGTVPAGVNGVSYFRVTAANGAQSDANQIFTLTIDQAPVFTSSQTTAFSAGAMGMFVITTAGYPAVTSITQTGMLPTGVTFTDNHDGTATLTSPAGSGTPGSFMLNLTATNGIAPDATQTLNLNVNQSGSIASAPAATFTVGSTGTFTITTNSFTVTPHIMQTSPMPAGVTFHDNGDGTATLSGDPTAGSGGIFRLNFVASNGSSLATQSFQLTVLEAPTFTSASSATIAIGVPATLPIMTRGFPAASLSITTGMLGGGITFQNNNNGSATLLGTPPMDGVGSYTVTITASNGVTPDATEQFTLTIAAPMVQKTQGGILMGIGSGGDDSGNLAINNGNIVFTIDGQQMSFPMGQINGIQLQFGQGDDSLAIGAGIPPVNLTGGTGNITIMSANAGDTVIAGNGNDLLDAGTGTDGMFRGGAGQDTISGGGANTTLVGGSGNAMLVPASKHEFIKGGAGSDTVVSSAGHDSIQGGAKSNIFLNGAGKKDTINGGSGLNFAEANSSDVMTNILQVIDPAPPTTPAVEAAAPALSPAAGTVVTATDTGGVVDVEGTAVADHIVVSTDGTNLIIKNHGALVQSFALSGLTGILVNGKGGGDTITVASNVTLTETLFGGAGPDSITAGGGSAVLDGGAGSDTLVGGSSTSLLVPGQFETFTAALNGKDVLIGGSGFAIADLAYRTDPMFLSNDGKNDSGDPNLGEKLTIMPSVLAIWGGAGNDTVVGTVAGEFLSGGSGNATIQGGGTDDLLVGGLGTDTVRVAAEPVTLYLDNGNANRYTGVDNPDEDVLQLDSEDVSF